MSLSFSHCFVYVHDQDAALRFYTEVLGLEKRQDAPMDFMRWLTVGPADQPGVEIGLLATGAAVPPEDVEPVRRCWPRAPWCTLIFAHRRLPRHFERVSDAGAEVDPGAPSSRATASSTARSATRRETTSASASRWADRRRCPRADAGSLGP